MTLTIYNTLTRRKEPFEPIDRKNVRMYVCGPTVYDFAHIGNARPVVVFDVLYRLLRHIYGADHVTYARNITDVDDKIIAAAKDSGEDISAITERFTDAFHADMEALGALTPDVEPRATAHIPEMIALIEKLVANDHAYTAEGHVLFSVASMADYGKLSRHSRAELIDGARVEVAPYKKDPADFVLWKPSTGDQPGWDSPWGFGRPGWHLECSAMSEKHLGVPFDLHGGGQDLIFPHHENEIAQSRCAHGGAEFARRWMHNGYVTVGGEKMSKSLGNFITVRHTLGEGARGEAIRLALLMGRYRQPLDVTREKIAEAKSQLDRMYGALKGHNIEQLDTSGLVAAGDPVLGALEDDLNTPNALHYAHLQANLIFQTNEPDLKLRYKKSLRKSAEVLGILQKDPDAWFKGTTVVQLGIATETNIALPITPVIRPSEERIEERIAERAEARAAKNFKRADKIHEKLGADGVVLEDKPDGTTDWRRV